MPLKFLCQVHLMASAWYSRLKKIAGAGNLAAGDWARWFGLAVVISAWLERDITARMKKSEGEWIEPVSPYPLARRRGHVTSAVMTAVYPIVPRHTPSYHIAISRVVRPITVPSLYPSERHDRRAPVTHPFTTVSSSPSKIWSTHYRPL
jgi:hypothetical protein